MSTFMSAFSPSCRPSGRSWCAPCRASPRLLCARIAAPIWTSGAALSTTTPLSTWPFSSRWMPSLCWSSFVMVLKPTVGSALLHPAWSRKTASHPSAQEWGPNVRQLPSRCRVCACVAGSCCTPRRSRAHHVMSGLSLSSATLMSSSGYRLAVLLPSASRRFLPAGTAHLPVIDLLVDRSGSLWLPPTRARSNLRRTLVGHCPSARSPISSRSCMAIAGNVL
mmetsp:Transcript_81060/g.261997  ORF Transcript_81060/g.261997 Transcript_81060/m.261997 type:complete len:222 (+) Transcript_81060:650-1315(+)